MGRENNSVLDNSILNSPVSIHENSSSFTKTKFPTIEAQSPKSRQNKLISQSIDFRNPKTLKNGNSKQF